jgi:hypothetical protein
LLIAGSALATPFPSNVANDSYSGELNGTPTAKDDNDGVPDIYNAINQLMGNTDLTGNEDADPLFHEPDPIWEHMNGGAALISLTAGHSNTLGVYTDLGVGAVRTDIMGPYSGFGFAGPP